MSLLKMAVKLSLNAVNYHRGLSEIEGSTQKVAVTLNNTFGKMLSARMIMRFAKEAQNAITSSADKVEERLAKGEKVPAAVQAAANYTKTHGFTGNIKKNEDTFEQFMGTIHETWNNFWDGIDFMGGVVADVLQGNKYHHAKKSLLAHSEATESMVSYPTPHELQEATKRKEYAHLEKETDKKNRENAAKVDDEIKSSREKVLLAGMSESDRVKYHMARRTLLSQGGQQALADKEMEEVISLMRDWKTAKEFGLGMSRKTESDERGSAFANSPDAIQQLKEASESMKEAAAKLLRSTESQPFSE